MARCRRMLNEQHSLLDNPGPALGRGYACVMARVAAIASGLSLKIRMHRDAMSSGMLYLMEDSSFERKLEDRVGIAARRCWSETPECRT